MDEGSTIEQDVVTIATYTVGPDQSLDEIIKRLKGTDLSVVYESSTRMLSLEYVIPPNLFEGMDVEEVHSE